MSLGIVLEFIILGVLVFQFVFIINLVKKMLNSLPDMIHEYTVNEIQRIINDKGLFDQLKNYGQGLAQGVLSGVQKKTGKNDLWGGILGTVINRFLPFNLGGIGGNQGENPGGENEVKAEKPKTLTAKPPRNPFT